MESSLADFTCVDVDNLLPPWLNREELARDFADGGGASDISDGELVADVAGDGEENAEEDAGDPPVVHRSTFMPSALCSYGLMHCMDNLTADMHKDLSWWSEFHKQLKQMEALLTRQDRRERFIHTCVKPSHLADQHRLFNKFTQTLYEGRWKEIVHFLKMLKPLLPVLRSCWDANNYLNRVLASMCVICCATN